MQCPVCKSVNLLMSERQGIEIDYCPQCRGVWLDRGELDKIIERSGDAPVSQSTDNLHAVGSQRSGPPAQSQPQHAPQHAPQHDHYKRKKRGGFLDELFDFD